MTTSGQIFYFQNVEPVESNRTICFAAKSVNLDIAGRILSHVNRNRQTFLCFET